MLEWISTKQILKWRVPKMLILLAAFAAVLALPQTMQAQTGSPSVVYLSDLAWAGTPSNGWGPVEKDKSNGEQAAGDGKTLTLNGVTYAKGLGVNAASSITYNLNKAYASFLSDIGIDDEVGNQGSVVFQVFADGIKVYDSGTMTGASTTKNINLSVAGVSQLRLDVTIGPDNFYFDHGDWANARLVPVAGTAVPPTATAVPATATRTNTPVPPTATRVATVAPTTIAPTAVAPTPTQVLVPSLRTNEAQPQTVATALLTVRVRNASGAYLNNVSVKFQTCTAAGSATCPAFGDEGNLVTSNRFNSDGIIHLVVSPDMWYRLTLGSVVQDFYIPASSGYQYIEFVQ